MILRWQSIRQAVRTIPSGRVRQGAAEYAVKFDADYDKVAELADLEIANENGQRCHIRDVGRVSMATEELRQAATLDGRPCIAIRVVKKADANAVRVCDAVRETMTALNAQLPGGMGPPVTMMEGISTRTAAMSRAGMILSQEPTSTAAS